MKRLFAKWCIANNRREKIRKPNFNLHKTIMCSSVDRDNAKHYQSKIDSALGQIRWWEYKGGPTYSEAESDHIRTIIGNKIAMFGIKLRENEDFDDDSDDDSCYEEEENPLVEKISNFISMYCDFLSYEEIAEMKLEEFTRFVELVVSPDPSLAEVASLQAEAERFVRSVRQFHAGLWRSACKQR